MRLPRGFLILCLMVCLSSMSAVADDKDTVTVKVGGTIFSDFTYTEGDLRPSSFQLTRAYLNVTGTITPRLAFRITPDFARETRQLKFAYGQINLDEWTTKGSWVRVGIHPTPYLEYVEAVYRYRFQGTSFTEREGFLTSSDYGVSAHYNFPGERGDVLAGVYNGEGYSRPETNDHKAFQVRTSYRPVKGVRLTGFVMLDTADADKPRDRFIATASYEHARGNAGVDFLKARNGVAAQGWSAWPTPKLGKGFEALLRYDSMASPTSRKRDIVGIAYWMKGPKGTTAAVLVDRDHAGNDMRYGVHMVLGF